MPNRKSALKSLKKSIKRHQRNKSLHSELKTKGKKFHAFLSENKLDEAKIYLKELIAKVDKAASKGIIHKNKANREKSHLMQKLNKFTSKNTTE